MEGNHQILLPLRKNGLDSLFKEVRVFLTKRNKILEQAKSVLCLTKRQHRKHSNFKKKETKRQKINNPKTELP